MRPRSNTFELIAAYGIERLRTRLLAKVARRWDTGCWEYTGPIDDTGYGRIKVGKINFVAHRASWIVENGTEPGSLLVCHTCDNRRCINPAHLWLGTALDNVKDMDAKGRCRRRCNGRTRKTDKLTAEDAAAIRAATGTQEEIAARFGISPRHCGHIRQGRRWSAEGAARRRAERNGDVHSACVTDGGQPNNGSR